MMDRKVTAIIQARMTSTRLPGKVMKQVLGKPLLGYLIERLGQAVHVENIVLATTTNTADDRIAGLGRASGIGVFRGSENNVLDRVYGAAVRFGALHIMRITADCPLIDPDFIDRLIELYFGEAFDYACNCDPPTLPDGLDAEIFTFDALECAHKNAVLPSEREHVTPYMRTNPELFRIGTWTHSQDISHLRWTVDEPEDFAFVKQVIEALYPLNKQFRTREVLTLLQQQPRLSRINSHIRRNEGALKSLAADNEWLKNSKEIGLVAI